MGWKRKSEGMKRALHGQMKKGGFHNNKKNCRENFSRKAKHKGRQKMSESDYDPYYDDDEYCYEDYAVDMSEDEEEYIDYEEEVQSRNEEDYIS